MLVRVRHRRFALPEPRGISARVVVGAVGGVRQRQLEIDDLVGEGLDRSVVGHVADDVSVQSEPKKCPVLFGFIFHVRPERF